MALDSAGDEGVGMVTITCKPGTYTLRTYFEGGHFEMHYMGNSVHDISDPTAPELVAMAWTVNGEAFNARAAFEFNFTDLPAGMPVRSAKLSLYSNHNPINGDHTDANYGTTNAFYISRINALWSPSTTSWLTQPGIDTDGQVLIPQTNQAFLDVTDVDVTTMVNKMISSGNYGFKIQLQNETIYNSRVFYSSAATDSTKHPKLVVAY